MDVKHFHLHLISDSTGETVSSVSRAALAQFEGVEREDHIWSLIRTQTQLDKVIDAIRQHPGVVMYTLIDLRLQEKLKEACAAMNVPCISVLANTVAEMAQYLGVQSSAAPGRQHLMDEEYFTRVEAINFTLAHDDGQATWELEKADIVLVGVSRTSKSPTCVYLANRGYKAANIPFVHGCPLPEGLENLRHPLVVGLTISAERLIQIRKTRLESIGADKMPPHSTDGGENNYVDAEQVRKELTDARQLFQKNHWPVIDVTRRSVEETAATIIQHLQNRREKSEHD